MLLQILLFFKGLRKSKCRWNTWTNQGGKETEGRHGERRLFDSDGNEWRVFALLSQQKSQTDTT